MKTALLPASTSVTSRVAESAGTLRDVLRRGRANTRGQAPAYVSNLGKAVLSRPHDCHELLDTL